MNKIIINSVLLIGLTFSLHLLSCGGAVDSESPSDKLRAFCVRECVMETGDSSICDSRCECAAKTLSDNFSSEDFENLVISITGDDPIASREALKEFGKAFSHCKSANL